MITLFLGTPDRRACEGARSFENVEKTGVAVGYGLSPEQLDSLQDALENGSDVDVVVTRKDRRKSRAVGRLAKLEPTGRWAGYRQRYDVHMETGGLKRTPYEPGPPLDHWAVEVI